MTAWYKAPSRARLAGGKPSELHDVVEVNELLLDLARRSLGRGLHALASAFACHANFRGLSLSLQGAWEGPRLVGAVWHVNQLRAPPLL